MAVSRGIPVTLLLLTLSVTVASSWNANDVSSFVEAIRSCRNIPAISVAVVQLDDNNQLLSNYTGGFGFADPACTDPSKGCQGVDETSRFCIGSVTKALTAGLLGNLLSKSSFNGTMWDTLLTQLLPPEESGFFGGDSVDRLLTVRDILAHRMGLARDDFAWLVGLNRSRNDVWRNIFTMRAEGPLSSSWRSSFIYNNWMYALAGHIIEILGSGSSWENLLQQYYLNPLGMSGATFVHYDHKWQNFAKYSVNFGNGWMSNFPMDVTKTSSVIASAGSLCAGATDFSHYLQYLLDPRDAMPGAVPKKIIQDTMRPSNYFGSNVLWQPQFPVVAGSFTYGFGWEQGVYRAYRKLSHAGAIGGYLTLLWVLPDVKTAIYVSTTNSIVYDYSFAEVLMYGITDIVLNKTPWVNQTTGCHTYPEAWSPSAPPSNSTPTTFTFNCTLDDSYENYAGVYQHPMFGDATIVFNTTTKVLDFSFGTYGQGQLCKTVPSIGGSNSLRIQFSGFYNILNIPQISLSFGTTLSFVYNDQKQPTGFFFDAMDPLAPALFTNPSYTTTTKIPPTTLPSSAPRVSSSPEFLASSLAGSILLTTAAALLRW